MIVLTATKNSEFAFQFASNDIKLDPKMVAQSMGTFMAPLSEVASDMFKNIDNVIELIKKILKLLILQTKI